MAMQFLLAKTDLALLAGCSRPALVGPPMSSHALQLLEWFEDGGRAGSVYLQFLLSFQLDEVRDGKRHSRISTLPTLPSHWTWARPAAVRCFA